MLSIALYMCCQLSTDILLNGVSPKDGILERLAPEDVRACVDAQRTLVHDNIISGYNILAPLPQNNCTDPTCFVQLKYLRELLLKYSGDLDNCDCLADWMVSLQNAELDDEYYGFMHMCPVCQQCIRSRANKERRDIWLTLPETMGVDVDYHITTGAQDTESNILCFTHANPRQRRGPNSLHLLCQEHVRKDPVYVPQYYTRLPSNSPAYGTGCALGF